MGKGRTKEKMLFIAIIKPGTQMSGIKTLLPVLPGKVIAKFHISQEM